MPRPIHCDCNEYIEGVLCPGQSDTDKAPRAFARASSLSATTVRRYCKSIFNATLGEFESFCWCYTFNPAGTNNCLSSDGVAINGGDYADCGACTAASPPASGGGGGGGGGNGGGGGDGGGNLDPGGGGGDGNLPGANPPVRSWLASICSGQSPPTHVPATLWSRPINPDPEDPLREVPTGTYYFRAGGYCYHVDTSGSGSLKVLPVVFDPWTFTDCADCIGGLPATLCAGQPVADAPRVWVRLKDLPETPNGFTHDGYCYVIAPGTTLPIPDGVDIVKPHYTGKTCIGCVGGVSAVLCLGVGGLPQPNANQAPQLWAYASSLPPIARYFNFRGWCYSLDPADTIVTRPEGAGIVSPTAQFTDCATCLCGEKSGARGIKLDLCPDQANASMAGSLWMGEDTLPATKAVLKWGGFCWTIDPANPVKVIPAGAWVIVAAGNYLSCMDCVVQLEEPSQCPDGMHWNGETCIVDGGDPQGCLYGYHWDADQGRCVQDDDPPTCPAGQFWDGGACVPSGSRCRPGYVWDGYRCKKSKPGSGDGGGEGGGTVECQPGQHWDRNLGRCIPDYVPPSPFDATNVRLCTTNEIVGKISKTYGYTGKVIGGVEGCDCFRVTAEGVSGADWTPTGPYALYESCVACNAACKSVRAWKCGSETETLIFVRVWTWVQAGGGKTIAKIDGTCYRLKASPQYTDAEVTALSGSIVKPTEWFDACDDDECVPAVPCTCEDATTAYTVAFHYKQYSNYPDGVITLIAEGDYTTTVTAVVGSDCDWYDIKDDPEYRSVRVSLVKPLVGGIVTPPCYWRVDSRQINDRDAPYPWATLMSGTTPVGGYTVAERTYIPGPPNYGRWTVLSNVVVS